MEKNEESIRTLRAIRNLLELDKHRAVWLYELEKDLVASIVYQPKVGQGLECEVLG